MGYICAWRLKWAETGYGAAACIFYVVLTAGSVNLEEDCKLFKVALYYSGSRCSSNAEGMASPIAQQRPAIFT